MVGIAWYLPTGEQWRVGLRQARCDLNLHAFDGTLGDRAIDCWLGSDPLAA